MAGKKQVPSEKFQGLVAAGRTSLSTVLSGVRWYVRLYGGRQTVVNRLQGEMNYLDPLIRRDMRFLNLREIVSGKRFQAVLSITCKNPANRSQAESMRRVIAGRLGPEAAKNAIRVERSTCYRVDRDLLKSDQYLMDKLCEIAGSTESLTIGPITKRMQRGEERKGQKNS